MQFLLGFDEVGFSKNVYEWLKKGTKTSMIKVKHISFGFRGPRVIQQRETERVAFLHRDRWTT